MMRFKKLMMTALVGTVLVSGSAFADIKVTLPHSLRGDACDGLPGNWQGTGDVIAWDDADCKYTGSAAITKESTPGYYVLGLNLKANSGQDSACASTQIRLEATCKAGVVTVTNSGIDLSGKANNASILFTGGSIYGLYKVNYIDLNKS